jgi:type I restriction enzyme, S subunit
MSEWKELSSITSKIGSGLTPRGGNSVYTDNGISLIRSQNVLDMDFSTENLAYIDEVQAEKLKNVIVEKNDILLNITGDSIARCTIVPEEILPARVNQHVSIIRCKNTEQSKYVMYYLQYIKKYLLQISKVGGTRNALTKEAIGKLPIKISDDCNKISKILDNIDQKIHTNNQINQELEAMAKTLYDYWFVQFDFPDQNAKPYKSSGGKMVYHPELKREIPEGWGVESVGNLLDKVTKAEKIENNSIEFIGEIPVIDQSQKYIAGFTNNENAILQPQDGHVIFGDHTRVVKYINFDYARGADGTQVLISNNENISNVLLYHMIEDFDLSNYGYARHFKFLKEKTVIVPDKEVSSKFETQANVIYEKIKNNIFENQELTQLRDWLLPMLMNGQVKVE